MGDPTWIGWLTTLLYLAAGAVCVESYRRNRSWGGWLALAAAMLLLGLNKQLDLQTLLVQFGRWIALEEGWYGRRRQVQAVFASILTLVSAAAAVGILRVAHRQGTPVRLSLLGTFLLLAFVAARGAALQHVRSANLGDNVNALLELSGIGCVCAGAWRWCRGSGQPV